MGKVIGGNVESCSRTNKGNGRYSLGVDEIRRTCREHFENMYNIDTQEQLVVHLCDFGGVRKGNYFE